MCSRVLKKLLTGLLFTVTLQTAKGQFDIGSMANDMATQAQQNAQQNKVNAEEEKKAPKVIVMKDQGLAIGVDVVPAITRIWNEETVGLGFTGRYGFNLRWYGVAETGYENIKYNKPDFKYGSNGMFIRLGVDYDIFMKEEYPTNNNILLGLRYGYSWQSHESKSFRIVDDYWGAYTGSVGNCNVNSHWLEALFGLRCEMLPNLYMSWFIRGKVLLATAHNDRLNPYAITGFGKNDSRVGAGFSYIIEYQIPTNRLKKRRMQANNNNN